MTTTGPPTLAVWKFASCDGCQLSILDCEDELLELAERIEVAVDQAGPGWRGRVGVVTTLVPRADFDPDHTVAMICGPEVMMRFAVAALKDRGVPPEGIHVSLERSMKCAIGLCGHCQLGPAFICKDGPVFRWDAVEAMLRVREL